MGRKKYRGSVPHWFDTEHTLKGGDCMSVTVGGHKLVVNLHELDRASWVGEYGGQEVWHPRAWPSGCFVFGRAYSSSRGYAVAGVIIKKGDR